MSERASVKVVKRNEVMARKANGTRKRPASNSAREIVSTVSDWVADLKVRKSDETKAAIERFFVKGPMPSET